MPKIQFTLQDGTEISHELTAECVTVGRIAENAIELSDPSVSSRHAELSASDGVYRIKDLGSTNGSQLNGSALTPGESFELKPGDRIILGSVSGIYEPAAGTQGPAPLPSAEPSLAKAADSSIRPTNFANASPFKSRKKKKDPIGVSVMVLGVLAILGFFGAAFIVFSMKPPL
jgi:predicted component of type VI protein secretion system